MLYIPAFASVSVSNVTVAVSKFSACISYVDDISEFNANPVLLLFDITNVPLRPFVAIVSL